MILPCRGSHPLGASLLPAWGMIVRGITSGLRSPQPVGLSSRDFRRLPKIKKDFGDRERQPPGVGTGSSCSAHGNRGTYFWLLFPVSHRNKA